MLSFFISTNPSIAFLWMIAVNIFKEIKTNELDKTFNTIIKDVEEEMEEEGISIAIIEDKAYWVLDNTFYQADIIDGEIDKESSRPVDAFKMSNREITKMLFILDNLAEG